VEVLAERRRRRRIHKQRRRKGGGREGAINVVRRHLWNVAGIPDTPHLLFSHKCSLVVGTLAVSKWGTWNSTLRVMWEKRKREVMKVVHVGDNEWQF
jgi:hypothetical protein